MKLPPKTKTISENLALFRLAQKEFYQQTKRMYKKNLKQWLKLARRRQLEIFNRLLKEKNKK